MEQFIPLSAVRERERAQEKCGISAWVSKKGKRAALQVIGFERKLNHRGEDNWGILGVNTNTGQPDFYGGEGRVPSVDPDENELPQAPAIIGHNRYGTSETDRKDLSQPVVAQVGDRWIGIAHNGNIPDEYRHILRSRIPQRLHNELTFDSAELAYAIACAPGDTWEERIANGLEGIPMAYALTMLTDTGEIYGIVGPSAHWPLYVGWNSDGMGFASETRAFPEGTQWRPVRPGELIHMSPTQVASEYIFPPLLNQYRCALHEVYGAKPDSMREDGTLYGDVRRELGKAIALSQEDPIHGEDVVYIGIPTSGKYVAEGYAGALGETIKEVVVLSNSHKNEKNKRERSFIAMTVDQMHQIVADKFKFQHKKLLKGKRVVMIDDSVIRGTTVRGLIRTFRELGAIGVYVVSGLTQVDRSCKYGYNIQRSQGLIALQGNGLDEEIRSNEEIAQALGADAIHFPSVEVLQQVLGSDTCTECLRGGTKIQHPTTMRRSRQLVN